MEGTVEDGESLRIRLEGSAVPHLLRVYLENAPTKVLHGEEELKEVVDWEYREGEKRLIVRSKVQQNVEYVVE
jgi:hypothetical protein